MEIRKYWPFVTYLSHIHILILISLAWFIFPKTPSIIYFFSSIFAIELIALPIYFFLVRDIEKVTKYRMYIDNSILICCLLIPDFYNYQEFRVATAYSIIGILLLEIIVNIIILNNDRNIQMWIMASLSIVLFTSICILPLRHIIIVISTGLVISAIIHIFLNKYLQYQRKKTVSLFDLKSNVMELMVSLVHHEVANIQTVIVNRVHMSVGQEVSKNVNKAINDILSIVMPIISESQAKVNLSYIVLATVKRFRRTYSARITHKIPPTSILTQYAPISLALLTVLNKAVEARSENIEISFHDNLLHVKDDGCGMDVSKIAKGYTTKEYGRGVGLTTAIDIMNSNNVSMSIKSKEDEGTTITFDLSKIQNPI